MPMQWLMTVQAAGTPFTRYADGLPAVQFAISPYWIAPPDSKVGNGEPPNPNCFDTLRYWPGVVEIRLPDGTQVSAELEGIMNHYNYGPYRAERNSAGRVRNPFQRYAVLKGLRVQDVPPGSEIWGEVSDDAILPPWLSRQRAAHPTSAPHGSGRQRGKGHHPRRSQE